MKGDRSCLDGFVTWRAASYLHVRTPALAYRDHRTPPRTLAMTLLPTAIHIGHEAALQALHLAKVPSWPGIAQVAEAPSRLPHSHSPSSRSS